MLTNRFRLLAVLLFGVVISLPAQVASQNVSPTQQIGTRADAAVQVATSASSAATITITPPSGQYVYIVGADISNCGDATGVTAAATTNITTTNLNGLTWLMGSGTGAGACVTPPFPNFGPGGLKSAQAGTAVTFVLPTFATHQTIRLNVTYFFAQ